MHDASAKLSSGILSGNVNQFGDFDECLSIDESDGLFQGQYCLAYVQPAVPNTVRLRKLHDLAQSHGMIKSNFEDVSKLFIVHLTLNMKVRLPLMVMMVIMQFLVELARITTISRY